MGQIDITKMKAQDFMNELPEMVRSLEAVRSGSQEKKPVEITLGELVTGKWGISEDELFEKMGINPKVDTMQNIFTMPQQNVRWIVPEIIRSAITLGMRQAPFYPNIIASDQPINGLQAIMPMVNMSDAAPAKVNEAETIPLGDVASDRNQLASSKSEKVSNLLTKFATTFHSMSWESIFVTLVFSWVMLWILWLWTWLSMVTTLMALSLPR